MSLVTNKKYLVISNFLADDAYHLSNIRPKEFHFKINLKNEPIKNY